MDELTCAGVALLAALAAIGGVRYAMERVFERERRRRSGRPRRGWFMEGV